MTYKARVRGRTSMLRRRASRQRSGASSRKERWQTSTGRHVLCEQPTAAAWRRIVADNRTAFGLGALVSLGLIWGGTTAAFTSSTPSGNNSWTTGTVTLSDDDAGTALFTATGLVPGSAGSNCITVSYSGSVAATVRFYASASTDAAAVAAYLDLTIQEGTGGGFGTCTGFTPTSTPYTGTLATFITTKTSYGTGVGAWNATSGTARVYKVTYALNAATPNTKQGATTTATLQWEAQT